MSNSIASKGSTQTARLPWKVVVSDQPGGTWVKAVGIVTAAQVPPLLDEAARAQSLHDRGLRFPGRRPRLIEVASEIILVEDDQEFADSLAEVLQSEGHGVKTFAVPEDAIEWLLGGNRATLVLLDLRTPGMSAQRFRALLVSTPALRDLPVVVVSGDPDFRRLASSIGASDALEKPIDLERLLETIDRHCQTGRPTTGA